MMQLPVIILLWVFLIAIVKPIAAQHLARVVKVKDADTFVFRDGNRTFTATLTKIDAPELKQNWGIKSFRKVSDLIIGRVVEYDSTGKDIYGRVLVSAKLEGKRLDSLIIRNGWAWHYVSYNKETMLDLAMNKAVTEHLGLWACGVSRVCPPWLWRSYNARSRAKYCKGCVN